MTRTLTEINRNLKDKLAKEAKIREQLRTIEKEVRELYREREDFLEKAGKKFDWS